ncbi:ectomycorrhiza-induced ankyrin-domain/NACHT-domain-containing protein [Mycena olivaceomarginata]|nr:ectomycorrhiza-induced ankyrin-domain/NACHT-domain-containing protein [Mycena olivaceomarginata]
MKLRSNQGTNTTETWPPQSEVSTLVNQSGALFIYAATALRYIAEGETLYKARLAAITQGSSSQMPPGLDGLYVHILRQAFRQLGDHEIVDIRLVMSMVVFLRTPLSMQSIVSLSNMDASGYLSRLATVIHIPSDIQSTATVNAFHASFPDFVTDKARCSSTSLPTFTALNAAEGHRILASSCLKLMNRPGTLHYNMGDVPEELTVSRRGRTNSSEGPDKISEALKYSCRYWASHISETQTAGPELIEALHVFFHAHLLHWIEFLSALGELPTALESLADVATALLEVQLLVEDAHRCLQANFECIERHCFEIYQSALVWLPKTSLVRKVYANHLPHAPRLTVGLSDSWGSTELVLDNLMRHGVNSVAVSPDDRRVVSGSDDNMVWIWNAITGMAEATLDGHTAQVNSVAFSAKGNQIISGSNDRTVRIWNAATGEADAILEGHTDYVSSVASSSDGKRIASGSRDRMVRIWNVTRGETEVKLVGHTDRVNCVAFSADGSPVGEAVIWLHEISSPSKR